MNEQKNTDMINGLIDFLDAVENKQDKKFEEVDGELSMHYTVRPGGNRISFRPRRRWPTPIHPRKVRGQEGVIELKEVKSEPLIDVFEDKNSVLIAMELLSINEKNLSLKLIGNALQFILKTPEQKIKKEITIPKDYGVSKVENISFKNNVLQVELKKK